MKILKFEGLSDTGGRGKSMIEEGLIRVNGEEEFRVRRKLYSGDIVAVDEVEIEIVS